jgi:hypothetical protein
MLEKLTQKQEQKMIEVKNYWLDYIFSCKNLINKEQAKISIDWLYKFCGLKKPIIIFLESPLSCQYAITYLNEMIKSIPLNEKKMAQVRDQVWAQVGVQVRAQVGDQVGDQVWDQVGDQVWAQVRDQVRAQVGDQVGDQVWDQVGDQYKSFSAYGNITDYSWISFFDFFHEIGILKHKDFIEFKRILSSGFYDMIQLNGFCIVSNLPDSIKRDDQNRLHSESSSAISFRDGYELCFWHGVSIPKEWIMNKKSISKNTILSENNAEKRRCIQEIIGSRKYAELLNVEVIDSDIDDKGFPIKLFRTKEKDNILNEFIYFLNVICPSTEREYYLCVPEFKNVWEAKAWTFKNQKIESRHGDIGLLNLKQEFSKPIYES